jgi:hypothetical protein
MFGTIKSLIPEPRQADQPRRYVGRHRHPDLAAVLEPESDTDTVDDEASAAALEQQTA